MTVIAELTKNIIINSIQALFLKSDYCGIISCIPSVGQATKSRYQRIVNLI